MLISAQTPEAVFLEPADLTACRLHLWLSLSVSWVFWLS